MRPSEIHKVKGILITLSGPSGVGKGTVISRLMELSPEIKHSVSVTTRPPRPGEIDGVQYYFTDKEHFENMINEGEILEYDSYCGHYYGTPRKPIVDAVENGDVTILDITVPGSLSVISNFPEAVSIFLLPPSFSELIRRLESRGTESPEVMQKRLAKAYHEIEMTQNFDYVLVNDDLDQTAGRILAISEAEKHRYKRLKGIEEALLKH
ncbi:MAG: guanylate kinase [Eubacteriales bacterium]|jgi:guanylate kinase|nr:guanylate kinase [Eubacteriales bacterium]MDD4327471.1 guanylate kinase [Eubacteriales bacterium]MDD4716780.1 guanylate kinase [Eubacteriales bacterium]NCU26410.1 guanylate kinase [Candidatus Nomurabacteria bacterium]